MNQDSRLPEGTLATALPVRLVRHALEVLVALVVASYAAIICLQIFYRFVLNDSLVWSEELVRYGLLWGVMLGAALASDRNAHVALDPLRNSLSPRAYRAMAWLCGVLIVLFCAVVGWYGWEYINRLWQMRSPASQIPMRWVFASMPIGCTLIAFFTIIHLISGTYQRRDDDTPGGHAP
jgi:TRAP-type C4-dicarboxylate transport system permease small subunit